MRNVFAAVVMLCGLGLIAFSAISEVKLRWFDHPEATERLLWVEHTWGMLGYFASGAAGLVLLVVSSELWSKPNK